MAYTNRLNAKGKATILASALTLSLAACGNDDPTLPTLDSPDEPDMAIDETTSDTQITPDEEPDLDPDSLSDDGLGNPNEVDPYLEPEDLPDEGAETSAPER